MKYKNGSNKPEESALVGPQEKLRRMKLLKRNWEVKTPTNIAELAAILHARKWRMYNNTLPLGAVVEILCQLADFCVEKDNDHMLKTLDLIYVEGKLRRNAKLAGKKPTNWLVEIVNKTKDSGNDETKN